MFPYSGVLGKQLKVNKHGMALNKEKRGEWEGKGKNSLLEIFFKKSNII